MDWINIVTENLRNVRTKHPLVHNITNFVVMNSSANILLSQGAFPVMAHAINEVGDMVALADALVLNIGTLTDDWVEAMIAAGKRANELGKPVILDPVGAGATTLRTRKAKEILDQVKIAVLRGNASEINALADSGGKTRGVDSTHDVDEVLRTALDISGEKRFIVGVSGEEDLITDGERIIRTGNGVQMMTSVTGTGCGLSATVGAFVGAGSNPLEATVSAFAFYGIAGEIALKESSGPGSFNVAFLDALHNLGPAEIKGIRIREIPTDE